MAKTVPYEVVCGITGETLTEWREMTPVYYFSKKAGTAKTSFLHLDKSQPQVVNLLKIIADAQGQLWEMHNASPTSLQGKQALAEDNSESQAREDTLAPIEV